MPEERKKTFVNKCNLEKVLVKCNMSVIDLSYTSLLVELSDIYIYLIYLAFIVHLNIG